MKCTSNVENQKHAFRPVLAVRPLKTYTRESKMFEKLLELDRVQNNYVFKIALVPQAPQLHWSLTSLSFICCQFYSFPSMFSFCLVLPVICAFNCQQYNFLQKRSTWAGSSCKLSPVMKKGQTDGHGLLVFLPHTQVAEDKQAGIFFFRN